MLDHKYKAFPASLISASIVYIIRRNVKIEPIWGEDLIKLTNYSEDKLLGLVSMIDSSSTSIFKPEYQDFNIQLSRPENPKSDISIEDYTDSNPENDVETSVTFDGSNKENTENYNSPNAITDVEDDFYEARLNKYNISGDNDILDHQQSLRIADYTTRSRL